MIKQEFELGLWTEKFYDIDRGIHRKLILVVYQNEETKKVEYKIIAKAMDCCVSGKCNNTAMFYLKYFASSYIEKEVTDWSILPMKIVAKANKVIMGINKQNDSGREAISGDVRMYVWQRDGGECVKCGSQERLEFDHIIPISQGGSNTARNIQLLCETCNRSKGGSIA